MCRWEKNTGQNARVECSDAGSKSPSFKRILVKSFGLVSRLDEPW